MPGKVRGSASLCANVPTTLNFWLAPALLLAVQAAPAPSPRPDAEALKARERMVILDLRTLITAARQYAAANGGFVDELRCLGEPWSCIPKHPEDAPSFIDPTYDYLRLRLGYLRQFHAGPKPTEEEIRRARASPSSLRSFAYTAVPEKPGESGVRGFCGDSSGRMCFTADGSLPAVKEGFCAASCPALK